MAYISFSYKAGCVSCRVLSSGSVQLCASVYGHATKELKSSGTRMAISELIKLVKVIRRKCRVDRSSLGFSIYVCSTDGRWQTWYSRKKPPYNRATFLYLHHWRCVSYFLALSLYRVRTQYFMNACIISRFSLEKTDLEIFFLDFWSKTNAFLAYLANEDTSEVRCYVWTIAIDLCFSVPFLGFMTTHHDVMMPENASKWSILVEYARYVGNKTWAYDVRMTLEPYIPEWAQKKSLCEAR